MASSGDLQSKKVKAHANHSPLLPISANHSPYPSGSNESWSIIKIVLLFLPALFSTIIIVKLSLDMIMMYSLDPESPTVQLNSLFISETHLAAKCGSNFTTFNPNLGWIFPRKDQIVTSFYEQDDALLTTIVEGFHLGLIQQENVYMEFETKGFEVDQPIVDYAVTREIKEEFKRVDY